MSARYCYAVWMRHQIMAHKKGLKNICNVAELGPGDSLGIGLCAILCGCRSYYGLDAKAHANTKRNEDILNELVYLFKRREPIPNKKEFPNLAPALSDYSFPSYILTDEMLKKLLCKNRIANIHKALVSPQSPNSVHIAYIAPWLRDSLNESTESLDMIFSQAVMEHVENVQETYTALFQYLRPGGYMSHAIDYKSHGYTKEWNGHWTLSKSAWWILKGNRPYLINRLSHSQHIAAMEKAGFQIIGAIKINKKSFLWHRLAKEFRRLSNDDLTTASAFIQAVKP